MKLPSYLQYILYTMCYTGMKKLLLLTLLLSSLGLPAVAQPSADDGVAVFAYSADQLAARFAGKTRKEVLYTVNTVSSVDTTVRGANGKEYALVRYGKGSDEMRVFLFEFKLPQKLLAVADDVNSVVAMNEKYGLNNTLTEKDLTGQAPTYLTTITNVATNQIYTAYQSGDKYLVFQNGALKHTFNSHEYAAFIATVSAANSSYQAEQAQLQTQLEQERLAIEQANSRPTVIRTTNYVPAIVGTALFGGLVWSGIHYAHHHRHHPHYYRPAAPRHHHSTRPGHLPPLKSSGAPRGTPLIRNVDGKYMNRH